MVWEDRLRSNKELLKPEPSSFQMHILKVRRLHLRKGFKDLKIY